LWGFVKICGKKLRGEPSPGRPAPRRRARLLLLALAAGIGGWPGGSHAAPAAAATAPAPVRIVSYNVYNYLPLSKPQIKSPESRQTVLRILAALNPDIAVLTETGGQEAVAEIAARLREQGRDYPFTSIVRGEDTERFIGILARRPPATVRHREGYRYSLNDRSVEVQRGFAHLVFTWENGYRLHLLGAHLKSKLFDPRGQTDMRRYEARLLRYIVNDILKAEPAANILLVGDFNDSPDSSPLNTLINRRANPESQLYDLRPLDGHALSWTHCQDEADSYSRIDYALASRALLPEILFAEVRIPDIPDWYIASDHRPLVITLRPADQPPGARELQGFVRNIRQPAPPISFFHEGPVAGTRKARKATAEEE